MSFLAGRCIQGTTGLAAGSAGQGDPSFAAVVNTSTHTQAGGRGQAATDPATGSAGWGAVSFAEVLNKTHSIPHSMGIDNPITPGLRDTLIGRLIYEKKVTPLSQDMLERSSKEERARIFKHCTWSVKLGVMRLQHWVSDFDPDKINSSVTHVWIKIYGLPLEYWQPQVLWTMASIIGTPVMIDERTKNQSMCHYAHVPVELNLK
ncbi:hypothetical protein ACS0TY_019016 [Phlomoides rotata]